MLSTLVFLVTVPGVTYSDYFEEAAQTHNVSPLVLASIAQVESKYDPWAVGRCGKRGCRGIMQIHPANRGVPRFARDEQYRKKCRKRKGHCQKEVVLYAAKLLRWCIDKCGGLREGLGAYNTGRCGRGEGYAHRVLGALVRMLKKEYN
jgi:hypothetical protein